MSTFMDIFDKETITSNDRPFYTDTNSPLLGGFWMAQYEDEFPARVRVPGHLQTLIQSVRHLRIKVWRCRETRPRAGNSSSNWAV